MLDVRRLFIAMVVLAGAGVTGCNQTDDESCLTDCLEANNKPGAIPIDCELACSDPGNDPEAKAAGYCIDNPQACLNK